MIPEDAAEQARQRRRKEQQQTRQTESTLQQAIIDILNDYEQTAQTLDDVTQQVDGMEPTDHAANVQRLREQLLAELPDDTQSGPPGQQKK